MAKRENEFLLDDAGRIRSVTEFTREVKELLEEGIRPGWVRGEVSNLRAQASGHFYFSLKDAGAQLSCVLFRGDAARQKVELRDGAQVVAYGALSVYETRGQYQLVVRALVDHGAGRLQQELEQLKQRLAAEGLFDAARKKPIPPLPGVIGFITSPTGAAVRDFISILQRRGWNGRLVVLPVKVQGIGAAAEMAGMLRVAESHGIFELLVIGRGGGSIEDLWAFNEEPLVRAMAACGVPVISAVGHEIDYTLCDFVADARAETPSGAAELISSNYLAWTGRATDAAKLLAATVDDAIERVREQLDHARSRLRLLSPVAAIEQNQLRLDDLANRLAATLRATVQMRRGALAVVASRLAGVSPEKRVQQESHHLLALWKRLESASPKSVLKRGYAIVRDASGRPVERAGGLKAGQSLVNEFHDGQVMVRVE
jgi:exodeoxyribonuclease VII large subunit